eukprot:m.151472 g.151472  ORF g.151472 m.151472 type:complete len:299 (+) comp30760_c3_seq1:173-1069(+)
MPPKMRTKRGSHKLMNEDEHATTIANEHFNVDTGGEEQAPLQDYRKAVFEKGNVALLLMFTVMVVGIVLVYTEKPLAWEKYILSFGLFGFAGGLTNWIAVTMLFVRVPGLVGSGVIPVRYVQIRETVKDIIMETFFDPEFLSAFLGGKLEQYGAAIHPEEHVQGMLKSEEFDKKIDANLNTLGERPEFAAVIAMGIQPEQLKPMIIPFISGFAEELAPMLKAKMIDPKVVVNIEDVRSQIEIYMSVRMETLTAQKVTRLLAFVIRDHLGWLVLWGCVFGSILGVICEAIKINPKYRVE